MPRPSARPASRRRENRCVVASSASEAGRYRKRKIQLWHLARNGLQPHWSLRQRTFIYHESPVQAAVYGRWLAFFILQHITLDECPTETTETTTRQK